MSYLCKVCRKSESSMNDIAKKFGNLKVKISHMCFDIHCDRVDSMSDNVKKSHDKCDKEGNICLVYPDYE